MRGHYHCLRTGCYFVTNITTKLPWHIKKHEKAERRAANGFKYFTKREECGRLGTAGQGWGQATAAVGRAVALAPEAQVPLLVATHQASWVFCFNVTDQALSNWENSQNPKNLETGVRVTQNTPVTPRANGLEPHLWSPDLVSFLFLFKRALQVSFQNS